MFVKTKKTIIIIINIKLFSKLFPILKLLLEDYKVITISIGSNYDDDTEISLSVYREETDGEYQKRLDDDAKRKEFKDLAKERNKQASEKREKTLYEKLKKKYDN